MTGNGDDGGGSGLCAGLLIAAITLLLLGGLSIIIGMCAPAPPLVVAGIIAAALGLLLFGIWAAFCAHFTSCSVMQKVHCILFFVVAILAPILAIIALIVGNPTCLLGVAAAWGGWGSIYAWLGSIMNSAGCKKVCG